VGSEGLTLLGTTGRPVGTGEVSTTADENNIVQVMWGVLPFEALPEKSKLLPAWIERFNFARYNQRMVNKPCKAKPEERRTTPIYSESLFS
jgi:hypothetical protein